MYPAEARAALKARKVSAAELTEAYLDAMARARVLNAYVAETPDQARAMAKASDARLARSRVRSSGVISSQARSTGAVLNTPMASPDQQESQ